VGAVAAPFISRMRSLRDWLYFMPGVLKEGYNRSNRAESCSCTIRGVGFLVLRKRRGCEGKIHTKDSALASEALASTSLRSGRKACHQNGVQLMAYPCFSRIFLDRTRACPNNQSYTQRVLLALLIDFTVAAGRQKLFNVIGASI
jgi:hypothetical protein